MNGVYSLPNIDNKTDALMMKREQVRKFYMIIMRGRKFTWSIGREAFALDKALRRTDLLPESLLLLANSKEATKALSRITPDSQTIRSHWGLWEIHHLGTASNSYFDLIKELS